MSEQDELRDWLGVMFAQIGERFDEAADEREALRSELRKGLADVQAKVDAVRMVNGTLIDEVARINQHLA